MSGPSTLHTLFLSLALLILTYPPFLHFILPQRTLALFSTNILFYPLPQHIHVNSWSPPSSSPIMIISVWFAEGFPRGLKAILIWSLRFVCEIRTDSLIGYIPPSVISISLLPSTVQFKPSVNNRQNSFRPSDPCSPRYSIVANM